MDSNEPQFCEDHGTCICGNDCMDPNELTFEERVSLMEHYKSAGVGEGEMPTPDQLVIIMTGVTARQLRRMAVNFIEAIQRSTFCIMSGHDGAVEFARNHVCENVEAAYQRGADDFTKALQEGLIQLKEQDENRG